MLATWLIDHLMCGIYVGLPKGQFFYVITLDQHVIHRRIRVIIIHQTHYEKSDWSRAFNQFTTACELDMINVISASDITFIMPSSTSAWLLSPLECSPQRTIKDK